MKKYSLFVLCLITSMLLLSACSTKPMSPIKYERRLGKYFETEKAAPAGTVDLSEGPKLRYEAKFGPKDLNFDFKVINPY